MDTHVSRGRRRSRAERVALAALAGGLVMAALGALGQPVWHRMAERGFGRDDRLRLIGLAFKMYANESEGESYPPVVVDRGMFSPDWAAVEPYLAQADPEHRTDSYVRGDSGIQTCYLGFAMPDEEIGLAVLDQYAAHGPETLRQRTIDFPEPVVLPGLGPISNVYSLREGVERFFITEIMDPSASPRAQSRLPVLLELPDPPNRRGGWVLYLDGHCEWREYPGEFPMSSRFIERIRELMASM